jgi:DNA modification methylase
VNYNDLSREELISLLEARDRLLPVGNAVSETGKEYRLVYDGKMKREQVLAQTPAAPWQLERQFCTERPHAGGWRNLLVWGDNLLAMRDLLADQQGPDRFGTRGKIKLIYIDPPFATRQDFMKDKEKAYRDKVLGAQFIEFLRRRLIILHDLLAEDGSIYVHLDTKKGHYLKTVLDELFGEENFQNEIIWQRTNSHNETGQFGRVHDSIFFYTRGEAHIWHPKRVPFSEIQLKRYRRDEKGRLYTTQDLCAERRNSNSGKFEWRGTMPPPTRGWGYKVEQLEQWWAEGRIATKKDGTPRMDGLIVYLDKAEGQAPQSIWTDVGRVANTSAERVDYPTQKSEALLERIIEASSNKGDIVLDCFAGSGTTPAVAEKLGRRWIAMDCGKLAIYTTQKRLFSLTTTVGAVKKDDRGEHERVNDLPEHLKNSPAIILITEKARKGESEVNLELLHDLAALAKKHDLVKNGASLSLACPEEKLRIPVTRLQQPDEPPGEYAIRIEGIEFRISLVAPKEKPEKEKPLPPKEFALYRAGFYDMAAIKEMPWTDYRPFVLKLFGVREDPHKRYGLQLDGYIGTHSALIWNYPDFPSLTLDHGYVEDLHNVLRGKPGERFYIIAPVVAMDFAEDEVTHSQTTYVFLKVPLSVLLRLIESHEPAAFKQPAKEEDVNEVIDAVGFDFISQPQVTWKSAKQSPKGEMFADFVLQISEFRAQTLATDPEDFQNFETFSMAMVDLDYDEDVFRLSQVFWGEDLIKAAGGLEKAQQLELRIPENAFTGKQMMVILCDRYGNEKKLVIEKSEFEGKPRSQRRLAAGRRKKK